ncbi:MAG TPA: AhpC/TSA family protein [Solirubrobacteraceae bacterium]|nr:AhpC/TSA family protein [Solirubrobacteraceae bacterium]
MSAGLATFLRPPAITPAPLPAPGDPAPQLAGTPADGRPRVVAFLRHTGCPFAEATMRELRDQAALAPDIDWIAVTHSSADVSSRWCDRVGGAGAVRIVSDEQRRAHAAWGLGRSTLGHFLGARSLAAVLREARRGIRNSHADGTRWQRAGTFAVDAAGTLRWRHLPVHAGELPDLAAAAAAARSGTNH